MSNIAAQQLYALYLEGFIIASMSEDKLVLYNLLEQRGKSFEITNEWTYNQIADLLSPLNGYSIIISRSFDELPNDLKRIVRYIHDSFWGDFIRLRNQRKPITFFPICNIEEHSVSEKDVKSITIALNSFCMETSFPIQEQLPYLYISDQPEYLDFARLVGFLNIIPKDYKIFIIGGDLTKYKEINQLLAILSLFNSYMIYSFYDLSIIDKDHITKIDVSKTILNSYEQMLVERDFNQIITIITSEKDYYELTFSQKYKNVNNKIFPYYNATNNRFFQKHVSILKSSLLEGNINKFTFFLNQIINRNAWGKLFITPTGIVLDSYGGTSLGQLETPFKQILSRIDDKSTWFETRQKRCPNCAFRHFCVPVSAYERINNHIPICHD